MTMTPSRSVIVGALIGGAVGDAMGAPFEGLWSHDIPSAESLASSFHEYHGHPTGQYTDDTQLTVATVQSIVQHGDIVTPDIARSISELWRHHSVIGPGGACTHAAESYLATGDYENMGAPVGQAGNGTAMRIAAIRLWFGGDIPSLVSTVADISRLTHQDPRSVAGGVVIALAANRLAADPFIDSTDLCYLLADTISEINGELSSLIRALPIQMQRPDCERFIAAAGQSSTEFAAPIISPFVVPTVLASLYCVFQHRNSWVDAVTSAVQLGGDVDTLGAIVGALAGVIHGVESIPPKLVSDLQDSSLIQVLASRYHTLIEGRSGECPTT
ncbi:MAG: ADP-ribosylglycohydrolase family protein [Planctomycetales bacterium]|nr:ADP-ribosylglycohydrolase family protein [Planctomycetales bacterium]